MQSRAFLVHAISPVHAGTGRSADLIDLPIARMRATNIPIIPGSTIKGVLRDSRSEQHRERFLAVFGPDTDNATAHAGALVVGDAVLLAMPVRSLRGTFAWVSSPLLLRLAQRDLGWPLAVPVIEDTGALVTMVDRCAYERTVYLEDLDLPARPDTNVTEWARQLAALVSPGQDIFSIRFVVVDDETMSFLLETATQVDTRVRIQDDTGTVADGALWLEESLPAESLLLGLMAADKSRRAETPMSESDVLRFALAGECHVQLGGKATIGRGRCRLLPVSGGQEARR